jgi:hypothetical protein
MTRTVLWKPDRWDWQDKHRIVWVSVAKLNASWRKEPTLWLPPGSGKRIGCWLAKQRSQRCRIIMPVIGWVPEVVRDQRGRAMAETGAYHVIFENGRHRTAWVRDRGATALPVLVHVTDADVIVAELGTAERETRIQDERAAPVLPPPEEARRGSDFVRSSPDGSAGLPATTS